MTTLMLSVGVPMLSGGDEVGRTQAGNNNAYCQDNEVSYTPWQLDDGQKEFLEFTRRLIRIWRDHPVVRRRNFFQGRRIRGGGALDIAWIDPSGSEMTDEAWSSPDVRCFGVRLNGDAINETDERGERIVGDTLVMLLNASDGAIPFTLPQTGPAERWETLAETADPRAATRWLMATEPYRLPGRSVTVLRLGSESRELRRQVHSHPRANA
jgi:glycogen operon protein